MSTGILVAGGAVGIAEAVNRKKASENQIDAARNVSERRVRRIQKAGEREMAKRALVTQGVHGAGVFGDIVNDTESAINETRENFQIFKANQKSQADSAVVASVVQAGTTLALAHRFNERNKANEVVNDNRSFTDKISDMFKPRSKR